MSEFWQGVTVSLVGGGVIGLIVTVLANLAHPKVVAYLDSRKLLSIEKRKRTAAKLHSLILDLHENRRDKHIYLLSVAVALILLCTVTVGVMSAAIVIIALLPQRPEPVEWSLVARPFVTAGFLFFVGLFGIAVLLFGVRVFREITKALENFEQYDAAYKRKWGS
jgi:hypothetical protein